MKKIMLMAVLCLSAPACVPEPEKSVSASLNRASVHDLLDEEACKETKEGIGYFLGVADYLFKETEKNNKTTQTEEDREAKEKELWEGAIAFSQLAANYSTVYEVWCKD